MLCVSLYPSTLLVRVSKKCQNILFLLLKRRKILDFHRCGIPSYFSFPKQSFIASHTIISEVCFSNREFHSLILGVILCFLSVISLPFGCHFDCHLECHSEFSVHLFCLLYCVSVHFYVHRLHNLAYLFIVLEFILESLKVLGFILSYCHSIR